MRRLALASALTLAPALAHAVPGPDSVAVVANGNVPQSVALARLYIEQRDVPERQLCLLDLPEAETIDLAEYRARFDGPFFACLEDRGVLERIEAVVLARGVPLRVTVPAGSGAQRASLAATLGMGRSVTSTGAPFLGSAPGQRTDCGGSPCLAAYWSNPFRSGPFDPGWEAESQGILHRPLLVTMLHGRSYLDAARLVASATAAEALGGASGEFLLMDGADRARGVLDFFYAEVLAGLEARGFTDVSREAFDRDLTGRTLAAFFVGTAGLGETIEGNTFLPGAIVDNLTSFGAVPENFRASGEERQVSIARWVAKGVAGVHGTTDEPLNNCFPNRRLLLDYVDGYTLAEAYFHHLPFVNWRNLVLGDPTLAPYARRPDVEVQGILPDEVVEGSAEVTVSASAEGALERLSLYVDGVRVAESAGEPLDLCVAVPEGRVQVLAVAQRAADGSPGSAPRPKGWTAFFVEGRPGPDDCMPEPPDAGVLDAAAAPDADSAPDAGTMPDAGASLDEEGGCQSVPGPTAGLWALIGLVGLRERRRRRR